MRFNKQSGVLLADVIKLIVMITCATTALLLSSCGLFESQVIEDITPQEAFELMQDSKGDPNFIIIDVRTPQEFEGGHLEDAINIDIYSENFELDVGKWDRNNKYLVYCRTGNRSRKAIDIMDRLGFRWIYHMASGFVQWEALGLPVVR